MTVYSDMSLYSFRGTNQFYIKCEYEVCAFKINYLYYNIFYNLFFPLHLPHHTGIHMIPYS